jgi:hypothetical protein
MFLLCRWMQHPQLTCPSVLARYVGAAPSTWCQSNSLSVQSRPDCSHKHYCIFLVSPIILDQPKETRDFPQWEENQPDILPGPYLDNAAEDWLSIRQESDQTQLMAGLATLRICQPLLTILMGCLPRSLIFLHCTTFFKATCSACCLPHVDFLFGLLFNPEDGGDIYL